MSTRVARLLGSSALRSHVRRCKPLQTINRHLSNEGGEGTYYNSQLGQHIRISGAAGIRFHDVTLAGTRDGWNQESQLLATVCSAQPNSVDVGLISSLPGDDLRRFCDAARSAQGIGSGVAFSAWVNDVPGLQKWAAVSEVAHKMSSIRVSCSEDLDAQLSAAKELVQASHDAGMQVKAQIQDAFTDADGGTSDPYAVHDLVLALADAGADVLIVSDNHVRASEDDVVEMMEALLWFDVSGESMMERLGFRGSEEGCLASAKLGVTHFEAAVGGAHDDFVSARRLAEALETGGKKVALDWRSI